MTSTSEAQSKLPSILWVFASQQNFLTVHNLTIGKRLVSASETARSQGVVDGDWRWAIPNPDMTPWGISPFSMRLLGGYWNEYNGEMYRRETYPQCPSRLVSLFAFGDEESCHVANRLHGWDLSEVRKFRPQHVSNWGRFDMSAISLMNGAVAKMMTPLSDNAIWEHYWSGSGEHIAYEVPGAQLTTRDILPKQPTLWEYLIDGVLELI
jgi:hypothetical protein